MKEIKAFVRVTLLEEVVAGLSQAGFCCMSIIDVSGLGNLADPKDSKYSLEFVQRTSKMAKIELACRDEEADKAVEVIRTKGRSGDAGDGIIFVLPLEKAVKIRTGDTGDGILQTQSGK
ncbi:MAG: P-II family nitrogen regulator [bacterium]